VYAQHDAGVLEEWLNTASHESIERVNRALDAAEPWHKHSSIATTPAIQD
jgi:hypothetical protein